MQPDGQQNLCLLNCNLDFERCFQSFWLPCAVGRTWSTIYLVYEYCLRLSERELTPSSHMEVGCPRTRGAGIADPKLKQPEHPRARLTWNPATSPAGQKNPAQSPPQEPVWTGRTVGNLLGKYWRLYKKYLTIIRRRRSEYSPIFTSLRRIIVLV